VVSLNSLGQDRKYTEEEKLFALRCVQAFRDRWEKLEQENLKHDVTAKLDRSEFDKVYKEHYEALDQSELEKIVEDAVANAGSGDGDEPLSDSEKLIIGHKSKFLRIIQTFYSPNQAAAHRAKMDRMERERNMRSGGGTRAESALGSAKGESVREGESMKDGTGTYIPMVPEQWKEKIRDFKNLSVVKFPRIFQSLFYLLKFMNRDIVCERDTNKLSWKKTKVFLNNDDLFVRMSEYWPFGPKEEKYNEYEKLKFIKTNLDGITEEMVDEYSVALGKLFRWIHIAIDFRMEDVKIRRRQKVQLRAEKKAAQEREDERLEKKKAMHEEQKQAFDEKTELELDQKRQEEGDDFDENYKPEFDEEEFNIRFDEEFYPVEIPEEVEDDIDNDFNLVIEDDPEEA